MFRMENENQNDEYMEVNVVPSPHYVGYRSGQTHDVEHRSGQTSSGQMASLATDVQNLYKKLVRLVVPVFVLFGICLVVVVVFIGVWFDGKHSGNDERVSTTSPTANTISPKRAGKVTTAPAGYSTGAVEVPTEAQKVGRDCWDYHQYGFESGVYPITVQLGNIGPRSTINVYCDMVTDGGGWTLLLRRQDGSVNFVRDWRDYKDGFGNPSGEYWIGNEAIHGLTVRNGRSYEVHFTLTSNINGTRYAKYSTFRVESEALKYILTVSGYSGDAGGFAGTHNGSMFTTFDQDNDNTGMNCAVRFTGGWWFNKCHCCMLTGTYGQDLGYARGITWQAFLGFYDFLDYADMKIRPKAANV